MKKAEVTKWIFLIVGTALFGGASRMQAQIVANGSFESLTTAEPTTGLYTPGFGAFPTNGFTGWTLGSSGGNSFDGIIMSGPSPFQGPGAIDPQAQDGINAVFVQGTGSVSQAFNLNAGSYTLSYFILGSLSGSTSGPVNASISGGLLSLTNTPVNTGYSVGDWQQVTGNFTVVTPGTYTLTFAGTVPFGTGDHTEFIDNVSISAVPEPSTVVLVGIAMFGLLTFKNVRRRHSVAG